jgi:hypothetical protein
MTGKRLNHTIFGTLASFEIMSRQIRRNSFDTCIERMTLTRRHSTRARFLLLARNWLSQTTSSSIVGVLPRSLSAIFMATRPEAAPNYRPQRWDNSMKRYKKKSQAQRQSQSQNAESVSEVAEGVRDNAHIVLSTPIRSVQQPRNNGRVTLVTEEERIARGLPPRGRLRIDQENEIRLEKGLPLIRPKERRKGSAVLNPKALLTPDQREAAGLCRHVYTRLLSRNFGSGGN